MTKIVASEKARQRRSGTNVLTILVVALLLAIVAWGAVEIYGMIIAPDQVDTQTTATTSQQQ